MRNIMTKETYFLRYLCSVGVLLLQHKTWHEARVLLPHLLGQLLLQSMLASPLLLVVLDPCLFCLGCCLACHPECLAIEALQFLTALV